MGRKAKEKMSIVTVVSFEKLSRCVCKIAIARTAGSMVTLTSVGNVTRDGTNFIPSPALRRMLENSGQKATEVTQENGNEKIRN
jgi:hypothetical protein